MGSISVYAKATQDRTRPVGEPLEQAPISDAEVLLLDVGDPYRDILWNQEHLRTVERSLSARRLELVQSIRRRVVSEAGKREWESWMDAIFARHCSLSTELELIDRVLPLIRRAEGDELTVWFFGD